MKRLYAKSWSQYTFEEINYSDKWTELEWIIIFQLIVKVNTDQQEWRTA